MNISIQTGVVFVSFETEQGSHRAVFEPDTPVDMEIDSVNRNLAELGITGVDWEPVKAVIESARTPEVMEAFNEAKAVRLARIEKENQEAKDAERRMLLELAERLKAL